MNVQSSLPVSLKKNLDIEDIEYECILTQEVEDAESLENIHPTPEVEERVKAILLQDGIGKIQALVTHDSMLDLSFVCESLGRNLLAVTLEEQEKIAHSLGLKTLGAVPHATGYPTVVDNILMEKPILYLETGVPGIFIKVSNSAFKKMTAGSQFIASTRNVTRFLPTVSSQKTDDNMIRNAVEEFTTLRIKQRLENTLEIPPMPDTAKKIIKLRVDPDAGVGELAQVVETDPSLAAQVVSWASSPYYAAPGKISSVHDAVVRVLGFDLVINLALGLALGKTLSLPKDNVHDSLPYWQQAVVSAAISEAVVHTMPKEARPSPGLCYLSGLLHNFGFLILGHIFPPYLSLVNRHIEANTHVTHDVIENSLLGITRDQICAWLLSAWSLPEEVSTAVKYQGFADYDGQFQHYPNVLFVANQIMRGHKMGSDPKKQIPPNIVSSLGIELEKTEEACEKVFEQIAELKKLAENLEKNT